MQTNWRNSIALPALGARARTLLAFAVTAGAIAVLGAMPAAQASTRPSSGLGGLTSGSGLTVSLQLPDGELESILAQLPVSDLGLGDTELSKIVSETSEKLIGSPLSGELEGKITTLLTNLLAGNPQATLGELASSVSGILSGILGKSVEPGQILESLSPAQASKALESLLSPGGIVKVLSGLAGRLGELGSGGPGSLEGLLAALQSALPGGSGTLQAGVVKALEEVGQTALRPILETLRSSGLSGEALSQLEGLLGGLGSLSPAALQQQLTQLLGALSPTQLTTLLGSLFTTLTPTQMQGIVEDLLGGLGTLTPTKTTSELVNTTGTNASKISEEIGTTPSNLPETLPAVSSSLAGEKGAVMSLIDGAGGLLGSLGDKGTGSGAGGGSGGSGAAGGSGGSGSGSGLTLAVNVPASTASGTTPASSAKSAGGTKAKFAILNHKVNGDIATIVLRVPAAGRVRLSGRDMKSNVRNVLRAQRLVLKMKLAKAGIASLRHRHERSLKVRLKAAFAPVHGTHATSGTVLTFRSQSA
jgi:hypothetical protein